MSEKLKQLEEHRVIQEVSGSTSWIKRLVVTEKAKGDIRICLDIRGTQIMRSLGWMATVVCMQVSLTHVNKIETRYGVLHLHMKLSEVHDTCLSYLSSSCKHKF